MSKHSKKGKKEKHKKHDKKHRKQKPTVLAKGSARLRREVGVVEDAQGNILVAAKAQRIGREVPSSEEDTEGAWSGYVSGGKNHDGTIIDDVLYRDNNYVIYLQGDRVVPEGDPETLREACEIAPLVGRVTALKPEASLANRAVLIEIARAYDICLSGKREESKAVLKQLLSRLESSHIAMARLHYVWAGIVASAACWIFIYLCYANGLVTASRLLWFQALGVGSTGGFFAVALSQRTIPIDLSHSTLVHWTSGVARILIAMAAALVVLLAIKGGIFMGVAGEQGNGYPELFFCFLAGFSETFVQKLLRENEKPDAGNPPSVPEPHRESQSKHALLK